MCTSSQTTVRSCCTTALECHCDGTVGFSISTTGRQQQMLSSMRRSFVHRCSQRLTTGAQTQLCAVTSRSTETDVALPESAFGGKDERGRDITTSMLMPHCVIEPHGLSHSGLEH